MDNEHITDILNATRLRPKIIARDNTILESETLESTREVVTMDDGKKYVVQKWIEQVTTRHILVREFDPDTSYQDALETFVDEPEK